jgi:hypothetical protein
MEKRATNEKSIYSIDIGLFIVWLCLGGGLLYSNQAERVFSGGL